MSDLTSELNLVLAEDDDDTADYLVQTAGLRGSLSILDGLFNSATGHNHQGAHQGGAIRFQDLTVNGNLSVVGQATFQASVQCNTTLTVTGTATLNGGLTVNTIHATGAVTLDSTLSVSTLTVSGAASVGSTLTVGNLVSNGNVNVNGGTLYFEGSNQVMIQWRSDLGALYFPYGNGIYVGGGTSTFTGNLQVNSTLTANGRITANGDMMLVATNPFYFKDGSVYLQRREDPGNTGTTLVCNSPNGFITNQFVPTGGNGYFAHSTRGGAPSNELKAESHLYIPGNVYYGGSMNPISTVREKRDIVNIAPDEALGLVMDPRVDPFRYSKKTLPEGTNQANDRYIGFGAESMLEVVPEVVALTDVDGQMLPAGLDYTQLIPLLWGAVRALNARLDSMEA